MEPIKLIGKERYDWERQAIRRTSGARQAMFRAILDYAAGKAFCWPSNDTLGGIVGVKLRAVVYGIRSLEAAGAIRTIQRNDLPGRRMIVILGHPGTAQALQWHASRNKEIATDCKVDPLSSLGVTLHEAASKRVNESKENAGPSGRSGQPPVRTGNNPAGLSDDDWAKLDPYTRDLLLRLRGR